VVDLVVRERRVLHVADIDGHATVEFRRRVEKWLSCTVIEPTCWADADVFCRHLDIPAVCEM